MKTLVEQNDVNIPDFITWNNNKFIQMDPTSSYAKAYGMVWFLFQKHENILIDMIRGIRSGQSSIDVFNQYYPGGIERYVKDFSEYFRR